ncbi:unnamed protein product [Amoebophrya sp. A120]|nr:unnamed protein product [Amoebophrya sp. A120]|eukprot:GSA120T00008512001.1
MLLTAQTANTQDLKMTSPAQNGAPAAPGAVPQAAPAPTAEGGVANVWNVISGDTFEVCMGVNKGHVDLKRITIAGILAPRLGIKSQQVDTKDEPLAWESKEFLRKMLLAKKVQFRVLYKSASGDRDYYEVRIAGEKTHVGLKSLSAGMSKIAPGNQVKSLNLYADLEVAENEAKSQALGVHAAMAPVRELAAANDDPDTFLAQNKEKLRPCVVEFIKDAGGYRVVCLPTVEDPRYVTVQVLLSGVQNPSFRREAGGVEVESQPGNGAFFARAFAMERLLGREINLRVESIQRQGAPGSQNVFFLGSLVHPAKGSIAEFFLDAGFGLYVDWSAQRCFSGPEQLQNAQKRAQDSRKGRWKNWDGSSDSLDSFEFNGKVTEICSGDVLRIVNTEAPDRNERRYYLASVRGPQITRGGNNQDGWGPAVVEYMRKKCIGKQFKVRLEYKKNISVFGEGNAHPPASNEKTGDMYFVTLTDANKKNIAVEAVESGMLKVLANSGGAESMNERSRDFDALMEAEQAAILASKGMHAGEEKAPKQPVYTELILQPPNAPKSRGPTTKKELTERAKAFESQLCANRNGHDATVTYLMNGSRMRIKLIHEKILMNFQMNGVRAPNAERQMPATSAMAANIPKAEPFGTESLQFARELVMQQDVKVVLDRVDPAGTFQGTLYLKKGGSQKGPDMATMLLEKGLAYCDQWCNNQSYFTIESRAKTAKLNYWSVEHEDLSAVQEQTQNLAGQPVKGEISQINSLDSFYLIPAGGAQLKIQNELNQQISKFEEVSHPQKRSLYAVQYWEDKKWYRGRLEGKGTEGQFSFFFPDFGYTADVDSVRKIPAGSSLLTTPGVAMHCALYGVRTNDEYWEQACETFFKCTEKKTVNGSIEKSAGGQSYCVLFASGICVNEALVKDAVARLTKKESKPLSVDYNQWKKAETEAKRGRAKMWRYGDVGSDDEDY